jgi:hypothetical protein
MPEDKTIIQSNVETETEYESQLAKTYNDSNKFWDFNGKNYPVYPAKGEQEVATKILNRQTGQSNGTILIHKFGWDSDSAFIKRESAFVTKLRSVGRNAGQEIQQTHLVTTNAEFYRTLIQSGEIHFADKNETKVIQKTAEEMQSFCKNYPETAGEAIETWLDSASAKLLEENESSSFEWMFDAPDTIKVLWKLGNPDNPNFLGVLTFKAPINEARKDFDDYSQKIKSRKEGDVNVAELSENFARKLTYGAKHLRKIEGISFDGDDKELTPAVINKFITAFNPIWFADCVEVMHESFNFAEGK